MILSIIIGVVIVFNTYLGYQQGLIYKLIHLCSYLVAGWVAFRFTHPFSNFLLSEQSNINIAVVNAIVCLLLFIITFSIIRRVGQSLNRISKVAGLHFLNSLLGAGLGLILGYLICFWSLKLTLPLSNQWLTDQYAQSTIAQFINNNSFGLLNWITNI